MEGTVVISAAVEGILDEAVVRRLIACVRASPGSIYGKNGKAHVRRKIQGYNNAAQRSPWIILVDLDQDADCAPPLRRDWLPDPAPYMCFRVAVRALEAWLLADRQNIASFLGIRRGLVTEDPEHVADPKQTMVNLARESRRSAIREDMVPRSKSGRKVGPAYSSRLIEFVSTLWRPDVASERSDSLKRAIHRLEDLVAASRTEYDRK